VFDSCYERKGVETAVLHTHDCRVLCSTLVMREKVLKLHYPAEVGRSKVSSSTLVMREKVLKLKTNRPRYQMLTCSTLVMREKVLKLKLSEGWAVTSW